jgi:hypothetical protein
MTEANDAQRSDAAEDEARNATLARLAQSRAEICRVLEPPPRVSSSGGKERSDGQHSAFPRSRTMKLLMSGRGIGAVGAVVGGLALARPALAFRLLRLLPSGAVARMLILKAFSALRAKE